MVHKKSFNNWVGLGLSLIIVGFLLVQPLFDSVTRHAEADASQKVSGWAWSGYDSNGNGVADAGAGWISFNCTNTDTCGSTNYGVDLDTASNPGSFSGYAWSSNLGWIDFAPTGPYPSGSGTVAAPAQLRDGSVEGWARACTVFASGCSGALKAVSELGGWDGWISLKGSNYGVIAEGGVLKGFAWGGDGLGWIDFDSAIGAAVTVEGGSPPSLAFNADPGAIEVGENTTLSWNTDGFACEASGDWGGSKAVPNDSEEQGPLSTDKSYTLSCSNAFASTEITRNVTVLPEDYALLSSNDPVLLYTSEGGVSGPTTIQVLSQSGFTEDIAIEQTDLGRRVSGSCDYTSSVALPGVIYTFDDGTESGSSLTLSEAEYTSGAELVVSIDAEPAASGAYCVQVSGTSSTSGIERTVDVILHVRNKNPVIEEF